MAKVTVESVLQRLREGKTSLTCKELCDLLTSLGYVVLSNDTPTHKQYDHPDIPEWDGASFCCPHRRGDVVLRPYVLKVKGVVEGHKEQLKMLRGEK